MSYETWEIMRFIDTAMFNLFEKPGKPVTNMVIAFFQAQISLDNKLYGLDTLIF